MDCGQKPWSALNSLAVNQCSVLRQANIDPYATVTVSQKGEASASLLKQAHLQAWDEKINTLENADSP